MMVLKKKMTLSFYRNLGKLFYAIAAADGHIKAKEIDALKVLVKKQWLAIDEVEDAFGVNAAYQIEIVFDWLQGEDNLSAKECFNDFLIYKKSQSSLFSEEVNKLIIKTASAIAYAFSGINKSELIMLATLDLELKKKTI